MFMQIKEGTENPEAGLTQVHTNVHYCHLLPKELSNKGNQTCQRVECPY